MNIMHVDYHQSLTCLTTVIVPVHTHNDSRSIETKCMMQYDYESRPHVMIVVHTQQWMSACLRLNVVVRQHSSNT
jgi:hypothetical protein